MRLKDYITPMKKVKKGGPLGMGQWGFMAPEMATFVYALVTAAMILFTWTTIHNPSDLLCMRLQYISGIIALRVVFWFWPCRLVLALRIGYLLLMLSTWYPDTYAINKGLECHDHVIATIEQTLFGLQPALVFAKEFDNAFVSEMMYMGYFSYYAFFVITIALLFYKNSKQLERTTFMIMTGFYICYVIYILFPVTGPQYYYLAAGLQNVTQGTFPDVGHYFQNHSEAMAMPGWTNGLFYKLVEWAHGTGERPTAAFPSSHVAIAALVMLMVTRMRMWKWLIILAVPFIFLCLSTVYIYAHYAVDAIAGALFGLILFFALGGMKLRKAF